MSLLPHDVVANRLHTSGRFYANSGAHLARDDQATARLHREWLKRLPGQTGKSLTRIADEIGIARSTLTRPLKAGDEGTSTLHARTIERVISHTGVPAPSLPAPPRNPPLYGNGVLREDAIAYEPQGDALAAAVRAIIGTRNAADPWTLKTRSLELLGYLPGDIVIVDLGLKPEVGDLVCAQINIDFNRGTADTVMRVYDRVGPMHVLAAATMDSTLRKLIPIDDRVAVKGVVIGMVRPQHAA